MIDSKAFIKVGTGYALYLVKPTDTHEDIHMRLHTANFEIGLHALEQDGTQRGWFEHDEHGDGYGGGLWFYDSVLVDYDGISDYLPNEILNALEAKGFDVNEMRPREEA